MHATYNTVRLFKCRYYLLASLIALNSLPADATPNRGANCAACHGAVATGMAMSNYQSLTNLGAGVRGYYRMVPGQTLAINMTITNHYDGPYALTINNLFNAGLSNSANHLVVTPDPAWANYTTYFCVEPTMALQQWTYNLKIGSNTPPDIYSIQAQLAGKDIDRNRWSQVENFYVQVVSPLVSTPSIPTITGMQKSGATFSAHVATSNGFTYSLEYRTSLTTGTWVNATQVIGNNTTKTLLDTNASERQRFYRVRVQ